MGGGEGVGVMLDEELLKGTTQICSSFAHSGPLTSNGEETFEAMAVEVYGFE
jgi:hypothetical protein